MNSPQKTSDVAAVADAIRSHDRFLLVTHENPDGDALGAVAAMSMALRKKNIASEVLILSKLPSKYAFIFTENNIHHTAGDEAGYQSEQNPAQEAHALLLESAPREMGIRKPKRKPCRKTGRSAMMAIGWRGTPSKGE